MQGLKYKCGLGTISLGRAGDPHHRRRPHPCSRLLRSACDRRHGDVRHARPAPGRARIGDCVAGAQHVQPGRQRRGARGERAAVHRGTLRPWQYGGHGHRRATHHDCGATHGRSLARPAGAARPRRSVCGVDRQSIGAARVRRRDEHRRLGAIAAGTRSRAVAIHREVGSRGVLGRGAQPKARKSAQGAQGAERLLSRRIGGGSDLGSAGRREGHAARGVSPPAAHSRLRAPGVVLRRHRRDAGRSPRPRLWTAGRSRCKSSRRACCIPHSDRRIPTGGSKTIPSCAA